MILFNFEPTKNTNMFKVFYSDLADKFSNNSTKQYYMNIEKNCHNFELCNATLQTIKKILACVDT